MAKMDSLQYIEMLKPLIEKGLAMQVALRTIKDEKEQSFVDGGALVSFTERLSEPHREDVLNGTLLAQLAADAVADRTKHMDAWYKKYVEVLSHIGWVIQSFSFQQYKMQGESFTISKASLNILKDVLTAEEFNLIERTIDSLQDDDNQHWWHVFRKESSDSSDGNFQICPCQQDSSGQVIMTLGAFYFQASASKSDKNWFWSNYSASQMHFFHSTQTCTLNEDVYGRVRYKIRHMLGKSISDYLGGLKLLRK